MGTYFFPTVVDLCFISYWTTTLWVIYSFLICIVLFCGRSNKYNNQNLECWLTVDALICQNLILFNKRNQRFILMFSNEFFSVSTTNLCAAWPAQQLQRKLRVAWWFSYTNLQPATTTRRRVARLCRPVACGTESGNQKHRLLRLNSTKLQRFQSFDDKSHMSFSFLIFRSNCHSPLSSS